MPPLLDHRGPEISALCRRFHIRRLDLFGSAARGFDFTDQSDLDFLVEYDPTHSPPSISAFFEFRDALCNLLGRHIDLTMAGAIRNPYLRAAIEESRQTLYAA